MVSVYRKEISDYGVVMSYFDGTLKLSERNGHSIILFKQEITELYEGLKKILE